MNLTFNQKVAFTVAVFSFLAAGGSTTDLVTLFGSAGAKYITASASLLAGVGGLFLGLVSGQSNLVRDVQAMPGVDKIVVNAQASPTLATLAVDPKQDKIEASPEAARAVEATAAKS